MSAGRPEIVAAVTRRRPPGDGELVELFERVHWARLPIPGALQHINVWLVEGERGCLLIDTGMKTSAVQTAWQQLEAGQPLLRRLSAILVTHHHPDHFGMARRLSDRFAVPVLMSAAASGQAHVGLDSDPPDREQAQAEFAEWLGVELDEGMRSILDWSAYRTIVSGSVETVELSEGPATPFLEQPWTVSLHEGHAPGHACLHQEQARILISGDQLLPTISSNISLFPGAEDNDPLGDYLASLDRLAQLPEDTLVLPAHGRPFTRPGRRIAALREEHRLRLEAAASACSHPRTTREVAEALFNLDRLDALNRLLATTETLAHLRWLELRGDVQREGRGRRLRWHATGQAERDNLH